MEGIFSNLELAYKLQQENDFLKQENKLLTDELNEIKNAEILKKRCNPTATAVIVLHKNTGFKLYGTLQFLEEFIDRGKRMNMINLDKITIKSDGWGPFLEQDGAVIYSLLLKFGFKYLNQTIVVNYTFENWIRE